MTSSWVVSSMRNFWPDDNGAPQQLVESHDHEDHCYDSAYHCFRISAVDSDRHVRTDAGKAEVPVSQLKRLRDHEEEPTARHAHHAVPDKADRAVWHLYLRQPLPPAEVVDGSRLLKVLWHRLEGVVEAECHVPGCP